MKFPTVFLLATSAAAIDLHLEWAGGCSTSQGGFVCFNWNPDTCCSVNAGTLFGSGTFNAIPGNWNIQARGHAGPNCGSIRQQEDSRGRDFVCLANGPFGGLGYGFNNKKKIRGATVVEEVEAEAKCVQPDVMYLADGTRYNYTAILEAKVDTAKLFEVAKAGASVADIPGGFETFKLAQ
ncbi:hypothetical protein RB595_004757 [Gaeumannomyces hyphopodioides]